MSYNHSLDLKCILICSMMILMSGCAASPGRDGPQQRVRVDADAQRDTDRARHLNARAITLIDQGELEEAKRVLREAIEADVMFGPARNNLGKLYFDENRLYEAAWEFEYAVRTMPHHIEPKNNLALVLERARRLDEAVGYYREALKIEPDNVEVLGNLLRTRLDRGDRGEEVRTQLKDLILKDTRPQWVDWARQQLALIGDARGQ